MSELSQEEIIKYACGSGSVDTAGAITPGFRLILLDTATSTNDIAKEELASDHSSPVVVIADTQTAGRGRLGRSFASPPGVGIYLSIGTCSPSGFEPGFFTMAAAVAVCRAIEKVCPCTEPPGIKWVNDIFMRGRKVCGILAEAVPIPSGGFGGIVTGIGINCFPGSYPEEIAGIAGPVSETKDSFSRNALAGAVISELLGIMKDLEHFDPVRVVTDEYRRRCFIIGKKIAVISAEGTRPATALAVCDNGGLEVEYRDDSSRAVLHSGEISIRKI